MNEIEPEKLVKPTQMMAAHLESNYLLSTWKDEEQAGAWMLICWVMNLIEK